MHPAFLSALARIKYACAGVNRDIGAVDPNIASAIQEAATEVMDGHLLEHFPVDVYQTGSGTATNMNMNEVLANRAIQRLGGKVGSKMPVHPNDHVNYGQSSNDVIPTAIHVAGVLEIASRLLPALRSLAMSLDAKAASWDEIIKSGRTHLMDATPIRLSQEVGGWASQVHNSVTRCEQAADAMLDLALGGTAVGTGINTRADFARRVIESLSKNTGVPFHEARDHFEAQGARDGIVSAHGHLETVAVSLHKIANDIRLLGSGPRTGFGELTLPALAPGSSIMPGKVNPVMAEVMTQAAARVIGNGAAVKLGGMSGHLQLNVYMPLMADALLESITLLANSARAFEVFLVEGLEANVGRCRETVMRNLSIGTALAPVIGYDEAASIAKDAWRTNRTVKEVLLERQTLPEKEIDRLLDPFAMTHPDPVPRTNQQITDGYGGRRVSDTQDDQIESTYMPRSSDGPRGDMGWDDSAAAWGQGKASGSARDTAQEGASGGASSFRGPSSARESRPGSETSTTADAECCEAKDGRFPSDATSTAPAVANAASQPLAKLRSAAEYFLRGKPKDGNAASSETQGGASGGAQMRGGSSDTAEGGKKPIPKPPSTPPGNIWAAAAAGVAAHAQAHTHQNEAYTEDSDVRCHEVDLDVRFIDYVAEAEASAESVHPTGVILPRSRGNKSPDDGHTPRAGGGGE